MSKRTIWLSDLVKQELRQKEKHNFFRSQWNKITEWWEETTNPALWTSFWQPTLPIFFIMLILGVLILFDANSINFVNVVTENITPNGLSAFYKKLTILLSIFEPIKKGVEAQEFYTALIVSNVGLGSIIVIFAMFAVKKLRSQETYETSILFKVSLAYHSLCVILLEIIIFILAKLYSCETSIIGAILVILNAIMAVCALTQTVRCIANEEYCGKKIVKFFGILFRTKYFFAMKKEKGGNLLAKELEKKDVISISSYIQDDVKNEYEYLKTSKKGIITDINIDKLEKFIELIHKHKQEMIQEGKTVVEKRQLQPCYLLKQLHDKIDNQNQNLICVSKELISLIDNSDELRKMRRLAGKIFIIDKDLNEVKIYKQLESFLNAITQVILNKKPIDMKRYVGLYVDIVEESFRQYELYKKIYDFEQFYDFFGDDCDDHWMRKIFENIWQQCLETKNKIFMQLWLDVSFKVAGLAIKHDNLPEFYNALKLQKCFILA